MANTQILSYIAAAREQHLSDEVIRQELLKAGWNLVDIDHALSPIIPTLTVPPPPAAHFGMWVAFLYIILFLCLYVSATSLGGILHYAVDKNITDSLDNTNYSYFSAANVENLLLNIYIAGIIVTYPIFAVLFLVLKRQAVKSPLVKALHARKSLIYLTLVGTFVLMIGHIIGTLFQFLGGNATLRSVSHLLVTFVVAGGIFIYLLLEVKDDGRGS